MLKQELVELLESEYNINDCKGKTKDELAEILYLELIKSHEGNEDDTLSEFNYIMQ